jgi:hypothetical protein
MRLLLASVIFSGLAFAASPTLYNASQPAAVVQIKPQAVPTSTTVVATVDAYIVGLTISVPTGSTITVTVADGQGSPIPLIPATPLVGPVTYVVNIPFGYWCPSGFTVLASGAGATYYAVWRQ